MPSHSRTLNPNRCFGIRPLLLPFLLLASMSAAAVANAQTRVSGPNTVNYRAGVISSICTMTATDGELAAASNRQMISSSSANFTGEWLGNPTPARITVASNMGPSGFLFASTPVLSGPTSPATSQLALSGQAYGGTSTQNLGADGSISTDLNVRFTSPSGGFTNGTYSATAVITCNE